MKKLLIICAILLLYSCDITKSALKGKKDIQSTEIIKTETVRSGDTLRIEIPKVTYKDTTIVKTNYVNRTEARIRYDNQGNVDVQCISAEIREFKEEMRLLRDKSKEKESEKEENFDSSFIIYIVIGIVVIVLVGLVIVLNFLGKQAKLMTAISSKL